VTPEKRNGRNRAGYGEIRTKEGIPIREEILLRERSRLVKVGQCASRMKTGFLHGSVLADHVVFHQRNCKIAR
jgi:hypothetical protein